MLRNAARAAFLDGRLCSETMYPAKADKTTTPQVTTAAACSGESLSPERKACLEKASTEAERIECNKESAIEADKKAKDADTKADGAD